MRAAKVGKLYQNYFGFIGALLRLFAAVEFDGFGVEALGETFEQLGFDVSVGVAWCKAYAKLASLAAKPPAAGLHVAASAHEVGALLEATTELQHGRLLHGLREWRLTVRQIAAREAYAASWGVLSLPRRLFQWWARFAAASARVEGGGGEATGGPCRLWRAQRAVAGALSVGRARGAHSRAAA